MSKHSKPNDEPGAGKSGRASAATGAAAQKAGSSTAKAARVTAPKEYDGWAEVANFVVTFERRDSATGVDRRITAHKMQDDGITAKWTGVAQQPMCEWIADHVGDWAFAEAASPAPTALTEESRAAAAPLPDVSRVSLSIRTVTARQAGAAGPSADGPTQSARVKLHSDEVFDLDATIEITGATESLVTPLAEQCRVQFFGRNMSTKEGLRLGEASLADVESGGDAYRVSLRDLRLPTGTYRLDSIATFRALPAKLAHAEGPMLDVL